VSEAPLLLVVDDTPHNVKLLADLLQAKGGYRVCTASSGVEALEVLEKEQPDLALLDVVMPGMSGYDVCRRIRAERETALLPVVMVTALDPAEERIKGIEAGADDFITKPVNATELLARVRSLLRIRELHERVRSQADELARWSESLEQRVEAQVAELGRLERLKRFFSPQLAELISSDDRMQLLQPHRRQVSVVFVDLRGFTSFAQSAEPEEVMTMLREFHGTMGGLILEHEGTLERFTGDGMMVFFNDPIEVEDPEERAVRMAVSMRRASEPLREGWTRAGWDLGVAFGIHCGYATLGVIGFEGRFDYAAIGTVTNQAARLCAEAGDGQILASESFLTRVEQRVRSRRVGELSLKGLRRPIATYDILGLAGE
jgi:class 3 adenylate cyclase